MRAWNGTRFAKWTETTFNSERGRAGGHNGGQWQCFLSVFISQASPSLSLRRPAPESDRAFCIWTGTTQDTIRLEDSLKLRRIALLFSYFCFVPSSEVEFDAQCLCNEIYVSRCTQILVWRWINDTFFSFYRRNYYAGNWASFTFNGLLSWIEEYKVTIWAFSLKYKFMRVWCPCSYSNNKYNYA